MKPTRNLRVVASYAEGFYDQSQLFGLDHRPLDPSTFENVEGGLKWANDKLYASLTVYEMHKANTAEQVLPHVPGSKDCPPTGALPCYYRTGASEVSRGLDFEVAGEILPGLQILASYNYNENEKLSSNEPITTQTPVEAAKLWLDWTPASMPQLSLRLGAEFRSRIYVTGHKYGYVQDPVTGNWSCETDQFPSTAPVEVSISRIARESGVSRPHVRKLLEDAATVGFLSRDRTGGLAASLLLADHARLWMAIRFCFAGLVATEALRRFESEAGLLV